MEEEQQGEKRPREVLLINQAAKVHAELLDNDMIDEMTQCFLHIFCPHALCDWDTTNPQFFVEQEFPELEGGDGEQEMEFYGKLISFCLRGKAALDGVPMATREDVITWEYEASGAKEKAETERAQKEKFDAEWKLAEERWKRAEAHFPGDDRVSQACRAHFMQTEEYVSLENMALRKGYPTKRRLNF